MGVEVVLGGHIGRAEFNAVRRLFVEWEAIFSRFREGSELNRVNAACADTIVVSESFARVVRAALAAARATDGLVEPTLGAAILAAGYDRDSSLLGSDPLPAGDPVPGTWRCVSISGRVLSRPRGTLLDLNGVVKSLAVDDAVHMLASGSFVSAGGDLATNGELEVELPGGGSVRLDTGGIATSGVTRRHWLRRGVEQHHLIDPRTGRPAQSCWDEVTVAASSCLAADVAARAAFLLSDDGPAWLDYHGLAGRFREGDRFVTNRAWSAAMQRRPVAA